MTSSAVVDDGDVEIDSPSPENQPDKSYEEAVAMASAPPIDPLAKPVPAHHSTPLTEVGNHQPEPVARRDVRDELSPCGRCGQEVSSVNIEVDGNTLVMESCDNCDTRRWQLAGEPIGLKQALDHVGEHAGRRR